MEPYRLEYKVLASDTDPGRRLRLSRLFTLLQEAAIAHTEALGFGREKTLDRGYLWVVTHVHLKIRRLPEYDERVLLESVPGQTMHSLYPRYSRITGADGSALLTASALWTLMDQRTRTMADPAETGVLIMALIMALSAAVFDGMAADWAGGFPRTPKAPAAGPAEPWTVPHSYTDLNGHMNNARYLDLAEDRLPEPLRDRTPREILVEYAAEIRLGETMALLCQAAENSFRIAGSAQKRVFRINFEY